MSDAFSTFIKRLQRPVFAVIFQTPQTAGFPHWGFMSDTMIEFASKQRGFLGVETSGPVQGFSTTMSFWASEDAIKTWESLMENKPVGYKILISKVEDDHVKAPMA
jgi:hypothetical protein